MALKICRNIMKYRKENELTQAQVAEYLGVSPQAVSKWEVEAALPDVYLLPKIAVLFGVSLDCLFGSVNSDVTELLVSKYRYKTTEQNYKEATEAVHNLLDIDDQDPVALSLKIKLEHHRAMAILIQNQKTCEKLLQVSLKHKNLKWSRRSKVQLIRYQSILGDEDYTDDYIDKFEASRAYEDFNDLLIALGQTHQYQEIVRWCDDYLEVFSLEEQQMIYPNLMDAAVMLKDERLSLKCFDQIVSHNEPAQVFNAWLLMWTLYNKLDNIGQIERCKSELLVQLPSQGYNDFVRDNIETRLSTRKQTYNIL